MEVKLKFLEKCGTELIKLLDENIAYIEKQLTIIEKESD